MNTKDMLDELRELEKRTLALLGEKPSYSHFFVSTIDGECRIGINLPSFKDIIGRGVSFEHAVVDATSAIDERSKGLLTEPRLREILGVSDE
jgi:hypothetical protein